RQGVARRTGERQRQRDGPDALVRPAPLLVVPAYLHCEDEADDCHDDRVDHRSSTASTRLCDDPRNGKGRRAERGAMAGGEGFEPSLIGPEPIGLPLPHPPMLAARFIVPHSSLLDNTRSEEHTSELQSRENLVCRLLLEKTNKK